MSLEHPRGEEDPSPEKSNDLAGESRKYFEQAEALYNQESSASLQFVLRSFSNALDPHILEKVALRAELISEAVDYTKRYLALLKKFPEFEKAETAKGAGYFPDITDSDLNAKKRVEEYERRLQGGA